MKNNEIQANFFLKVNIGFNKKINLNKEYNNFNFELKAISFKYLFFIISMVLFLDISTMNIHKESFNIFKYIEITIKIKGIGTQNILSDSYNYYDNCPNKIYLNEELININNCHIINIISQDNKDNIINTVKLIWNNLRALGVDSFNSMFKDLQNIVEVDLSAYNIFDIISMNRMFYGCSSLISINLLNSGNLYANDTGYMFYGCSSLISLNLFNAHNLSWNNIGYILHGCSSLISLNLDNIDNIDNLYDLDNSNILLINNIGYMLDNCSSLISSDLDKSFTSLEDNMIEHCSSLIILNLTNSNNISTENDMGILYYGCSSLASLNLYYPYYIFFDDISFNDTWYKFYGCSSLISLNLSNFDTSEVSDFSYMFYNCSSLKYLNISNFNTKSAINMEKMFANCESLTSLDLYNFNTTLTNNMNSMFYECKNLKELDLSFFDFTSITNIENMFYSCENLQYINLEKYNESQNFIMDNILYLVPNNILICLNQTNNISLLMKIIDEKYCNDKDWKSNQTTLTYGNNSCIDNYPEYINEIKNKCYFRKKPEYRNEIIYEEIINSILYNFSQSNDEELIIEGEGGFSFYLSNLNNNLDFIDENSYKSNKFSKIHIGQQCENKLKQHYDIENISLILLEYEKISDISSERSIQYEIFESLNFTKLDLSLCTDSLIDIYFPLNLNEDIKNLYSEL